MNAVIVDSNVLLDVATNDPRWSDWSSRTLQRTADEAILVIDPLVYAEVSVGFDTIEDLESALPVDIYRREELPYEAGFWPANASFGTGGAGDSSARLSRISHRRPRRHRGIPPPHPRRDSISNLLPRFGTDRSLVIRFGSAG